MAVSANAQWDVRTTGADTNSGAFVAGAAGADFSQQDSKNTTQQGTGTTLSGNGGSISSGATSAIVANATNLYGSQQALLATPLVGDWIKIDSEIMKVTAVSSNTLTITRGQLGTSAASHNDGATVTNISNVSTTDVVTAGSTTLTSATGYYSANLVGNLIYVTGGTGAVAAAWYQVTAVGTSGSSTTITTDRSTGLTSGTGATGNVGGALASPGGAAGALATTSVGVSGQIVYIKAGSYSIGAGTQNTSGNKVNTSVSGILWQGYNATHGDMGTKPVIQAGGNSITLFATGNVDIVIENIEFQLNGHTTITALTLGNSRNIARAVKITSADTIGINVTGASCVVYQCEITGVTGGNAALYSTGGGSRIVQCYSHGNSVAGFRSNANLDNYVDDISYNNAGHGFQAATGCYYQNCTAHGNTGASISGFEIGASNNCLLDHCLSTSNGTSVAGYGFDTTGTGNLLFNCAAQGNFTADTNGTYRVNTNFQSLSGGPYVSAGTNFGLNNTAGAGAKVRGLTWTPPGLSTTTSYLDGGAAQHQDSSAVAFSPVGACPSFIQGIPGH